MEFNMPLKVGKCRIEPDAHEISRLSKSACVKGQIVAQTALFELFPEMCRIFTLNMLSRWMPECHAKSTRPWESVVAIASSESDNYPDSKVHGANMGPIWGQQDPGGPHVGPMKFAFWVRLISTGRLFTIPLYDFCVHHTKFRRALDARPTCMLNEIRFQSLVRSIIFRSDILSVHF